MKTTDTKHMKNETETPKEGYTPWGKIEHTTYLAWTRDTWGTGPTPTVAMRRVKALTAQGRLKKNHTKTKLMRVDQDDTCRYSDDIRAGIKACHVQVEGYEDGDFVEPFMNGYGPFYVGHPTYYTKEEIQTMFA